MSSLGLMEGSLSFPVRVCARQVGVCVEMRSSKHWTKGLAFAGVTAKREWE